MEKLDLIIAALQRVELLFEAHGQYPHTLREVNEALAAARELKALKPVGWVTKDAEDVVDKFRLQHFKNGIPVYALDGVKHD